MEEWDRPGRRTVALHELPDRELPVEPPVDPPEPDRGADCLTRCLEMVSAAQRDMVVAYYEWGRRERIGSRQELAARLGLPMNALRLRVHRLRESLERCVAACLKGAGGAGDIDPPATTTSGKRKVQR
jgi:DNA-directed RNA polymerase specialized sigma24 family protein